MMNTIAAIATPNAVGGISVIRLSGDEAIDIADRIFVPVSGRPLRELEGYRAAYGKIKNSEGELDDGVALVFRAPKSYTGEDVVELSCHGGLYISRQVLRAALEAGAGMAENGEFTKRAFLNKKMSLTQAESVINLINAQSEQAAKSALTTMSGALYREIKGISDELLAIAGHLDAWVDYPEEEIEEVETASLLKQLKCADERMTSLLGRYDTGKVYREGVDTVIVGRPNVGKSTLMNLLSGYQKSIVTEVAGTTRDVVEELVDVGDGILLRLADTAGIRETDDRVERIGVDRAKERIRTASLVLALFDSSEELTQQDLDFMDQVKKMPVIAVINKTDLPVQIDLAKIRGEFPHVVQISAKNNTGIAELKQALFEVLRMQEIDSSAPMLANERQRRCAVQAEGYLKEAVDALSLGFTLDAVTVSVESAIQELLALTGERVTDAVVNEVFSHFCVGK